MAGLPDAASRRASPATLQRPEIVIKPRFDLAANLGVTTAGAVSQAIRIATLGDIDQNSAKFSLSDRQIPIRVALDRGRAQRAVDDPEPAGPDRLGRLGAAEAWSPRSGFGAGPTKIDRVNQQRRMTIGADLAPGIVTGDAQKQIDALPTMKNLPTGVITARCSARPSGRRR